MEEYPREVQGHPLLLASLVGATSLHPQLTEALHDAAVNACKQRRFKYLSSSYDMRILPAKRGGRDSPNYRWEGVLKRSWLEKMCGSIPAVLVLCIDWSQDLSQAEQEESQALHYLQHARRQTKERDLRLVVFVVLHPKTADPEAATRSLHEGTTGGHGLVVAKGLEDLKNKAPSLERLIYQNAMSFYADEEKRLRKAWAPKVPNLPMQVAMQVRTNFKVAFLNEFRKDARGALTAYVKAYELLLKESEIMDFLERMDLCNHIALRMYQRYFSYHDVGAAVHHCRIHVNSLKKCCSENSEYVWRKWHWLSLNHQIFGDLLDTVMQRVPLLIDISDIWQFPGFHFQAAAVYARRLREWAVRCLEPGHLPPAPTAGGEVLPSAFLGQAGHLERPTEVTSPKEVVALRLAWEQAQKHKEHAERSLKLLIRAQAAAKERNLSSWIVTSQIRVAEAYLCDQSSSHQEAARDLFHRLRKQPRSSWAPFQRFFLERALLCGCSQLGLPIPSLCSSTRAVPAILESLEAMPSDELRSTLVRDAFEYLGLKAAPAWNDRRQGEELLALIKQAAGPLPAGSIEIALPRGHLTPELLDSTLTFDSSGLAVPLALCSSTVAVEDADGDQEMTLEMGEQTWEVGQPFTVRSVPSSASGDSGPVRLRFTWALADAVVFVGESGASGEALLGELKLPGTHEVGLPERILCPWGPLGPNFRGKLNSELLFPVDPSKALVSDTFLFFLALSGAPVAPAASAPLRLTATVQVEEGDPATVLPAHPLESSKSPRLSLISESCELIPLGSDETLLAEVAHEVQPVAGLLAFKPGDLQRPGADVGHAWPIAVQCGRACKMTVNFALALGHSISRTSATITFQHAMRLQIAEERMATSLTLQRPVSFALKSLHGPVVTSTVEVMLEDDCQKCLGKPGLMAIGSAHAFIWPAKITSQALGRPRLRVEFQKHKAVGEFFQWLPSAKRPAELPGGGVAEWLLPLDLPTPSPSMQVELELGSIGTVGTPLEVQVHLKNATFSEEEIRVRILQEGDVSDRYLFSGPVSSQASPLSLEPRKPRAPESPLLQPFCLIPLKPGWVSLPKVQVLWANQEAISSPSSVFVAPSSCAPPLHRTTA